MTDTLQDNRRGQTYFDSHLDDLPLTLEAFRVYCHLIRRAGKGVSAFPSYRTIGSQCFKGSYPESSPEALRQKAIAAIKELISWNMLIKQLQHRDNGSASSNLYMLTDYSDWFEQATEKPELARKKGTFNGNRFTKNKGGGSRPLPGGVVVNDYQGGSEPLPGVVVNDYQGGSGELSRIKEIHMKGNPISKEIQCKESDTHTEAAAVTVEVLDPEVLPGDRKDRSDLRQLNPSQATEVNIPFGQENKDPGEDQSSEAARDNKYNGVSVAKLEELQEKFDDGLITDLPDLEKKALAAYLMGDIIKLYRKSGKLLASSTNDLNPGFVRFYAWSEYQDETALSKARATILKLERTISSWSVLASVVSEWKACESNQELLQEKAKRRASSKRGTDSELDKTVATSSTAERFRKIQEQQEREAAIKAAKEAERVKASEVRSEPPTGAASPPSADDYDPEATKAARERARAEVDRMQRERQEAQRRRA